MLDKKQLPDGQIISNSTSYGIKNLMDCTISGSGSTYQTLRCVIKLGNTFGNKETRKLYVDENTADGTYNMTVCTAKFQPTKPGATTPMFTKDTVRFIVKGKYTDDVTTHIVQ